MKFFDVIFEFGSGWPSIYGRYKGPRMKGIMIPVQINISVQAPNTPLMQTGTYSLINLGQKKEKRPIPQPYIHLPKQNR
jgi:hypothetical protein